MKTKILPFLVAMVIFRSALFAAEEAPLIDEKTPTELLAALQSNNRSEQLRAAQALSAATPEQRPLIISRLIPLLKSERENDRFIAAQVLGEYGPIARAAVPELVPLLQGTQFERNRAAAAKALGQILKDAQLSEEVERVTEALTAKFNEDYDKYSDVRRESVRALGMIGPAAKKSIPKLTRALTDFQLHSAEHRMVRQAAAWTCGRMGPLAAEHIDRLISMLQLSECWSRDMREVPEAIGLIGPVHENVVPNLVSAYEVSQGPGSWLPFKEAILVVKPS